MMRSSSPRWASLKLCARAGTAATTAINRAAVVVSKRRIAFPYLSVMARGAGRGFIGDDVVGANPPGRTGGKAGLGAGGEIARGAVVAAGKRRLRRREIGFGQVALAAVGHGELAVAVRHVGLARDRGAQQRDRLLGLLDLVGGDQRLAEHDADERGVGGERGGDY